MYCFDLTLKNGKELNEVWGSVTKLHIDGVDRFFFDDFSDAEQGKDYWLTRASKFSGIDFDTRFDLIAYLQSNGGSFAEFKRYWSLDNLPEVDKWKLHRQHPDQWKSKKGLSMWEKVERYRKGF